MNVNTTNTRSKENTAHILEASLCPLSPQLLLLLLTFYSNHSLTVIN